MNKRVVTAVIVSVLSVSLAAAGWLLLPDRVGMQITSSGQLDNIVPKYLALLPSLLISAVGIVLLFVKVKKINPYFLCFLGIILQVLTIGINFIAVG